MGVGVYSVCGRVCGCVVYVYVSVWVCDCVRVFVNHAYASLRPPPPLNQGPHHSATMGVRCAGTRRGEQGPRGPPERGGVCRPVIETVTER